tara:strand:+ start:2361 stop:3002 length:642 start_codon:yes stop_codon:yes gene_type:complete
MTEKTRPDFSVTPSVTSDMVDQGYMGSDPSSKTDKTTLYGFDGKPIKMGNDDPNIIGLDSKPSFSYRPQDAYPSHPTEILSAEHRYVLPLARFLGDAIGVVPIDEHAYDRVLAAIQSKSIFVVINQKGLKVEEGVASWFGLVLICKRHPVVLVHFKEQLSTERVGISHIRLWMSREGRYHVHGDRTQRSFIKREEASALILNYLRDERIIANI